jgi:HlyD family secretion protein
VGKATAKIETIKALVDQMTLTAPIAAQVYQIPAEEGEVVTPGVPLLSLVDLADTWLGFSLREDLIAGLKVGDRLTIRVPALGNREVVAQVRVIAAKGEYAGWRATRATGDFDLRTFAIRAYPVDKIAGLRPGMSVYTDWARRPP